MNRCVARLVRQAMTREVKQDHTVAGFRQRRGERAIEVSVEQKAMQVYEKLWAGTVDLVREPHALVRELSVRDGLNRGEPPEMRPIRTADLLSSWIRRIFGEHCAEDTQRCRNY